jgi:hypothetical protein
MNAPTDDDDDLSSVGIGPIETGVPLPRSGGFLGRLRRTLERLEIGNSCKLINVSLKQERYIRQRMPALAKSMDAKFAIRVADHLRDRSSKRTLRVHRIE